MGRIYKLVSGDKEYTLNFNSYAVMQAYKKYGTDGLDEVAANQPFEFLFEMIRFALSDNGRNTLHDADVYDFIDGVGGIASETVTKEIGSWIKEAFQVPEEPKKKQEKEAV